jgi:hypothetical protein
MADERWIDDVFAKAKKLRDATAIELETKLRNEQRIDALMAAFLDNLANQVREAVDAFNKRASSGGRRHAIIVDRLPDAITLLADTLQYGIHINATGRKVWCGQPHEAVTGHTVNYTIKLDAAGNLTITRDDQGIMEPGEYTRDMLRPFFEHVAERVS